MGRFIVVLLGPKTLHLIYAPKLVWTPMVHCFKLYGFTDKKVLIPLQKNYRIIWHGCLYVNVKLRATHHILSIGCS